MTSLTSLASNSNRHKVIQMKTIGLLGGMSSQATAEYYRLLNAGISKIRGGHNAGEILLCSVNFANIEAFVRGEQWEDAAGYLVGKARQLERGGADFIILGTNTMHRVAPQIVANINIPFIHIIDVTAEAIKKAGLSRVGILGTKPVMEADYYRDYYWERHGIELIAPVAVQRERVDTIIFDELCRNIIKDGSRVEYVQIMEHLRQQGAQAIILGCTELDLLLKPQDFPALPLFDTTALHVQKAVNLSLGLDSTKEL